MTDTGFTQFETWTRISSQTAVFRLCSQVGWFDLQGVFVA